ncbi:hypothetical protein D9613_001085 [Agrocybe pediades]|uniref:Uncharacterized protein n=1 Tax=Agrocybe pediades TaxID=84607 RepID=A0A8H4QZZ4_9AGAR|nr:hypothetical protein D9613_001085 [Agrocybe pediades]
MPLILPAPNLLNERRVAYLPDNYHHGFSNSTFFFGRTRMSQSQFRRLKPLTATLWAYAVSEVAESRRSCIGNFPRVMEMQRGEVGLQDSAALNSTVTPSVLDSRNMKAIYIKVEDSTFTVPRHILNCPGTPFEMKFTLPQPDEDEGDETTNERDPLVLEGIPVDDFETFVHASHSESDNKLAPRLAVDSYGYWMGVLKLATMWNFNQVRKKAVDQMGSFIQSKTPLEMVYLHRKHFVPAWVKASYVALCSQKDIIP